MAVGLVTNVNQVNNQVGQLAVNLRNVCQDAVNFQDWAVAQGLSGLEALGFSPTDAQAILTMSSYLNTVAFVFFGEAGQAQPFNFNNALSTLYGGQ